MWLISHRLAELASVAGKDVEELCGHAACMREVAGDDHQGHRELLGSPVEADRRLHGVGIWGRHGVGTG